MSPLWKNKKHPERNFTSEPGRAHRASSNCQNPCQNSATKNFNYNLQVYIYIRKKMKICSLYNVSPNIPEPWIFIGWLRSHPCLGSPTLSWSWERRTRAIKQSVTSSKLQWNHHSHNQSSVVTAHDASRKDWYIYLYYMWLIFMGNVGKYIPTPMDIFVPFMTYDKLYRKIWSKLGAADY